MPSAAVSNPGASEETPLLHQDDELAFVATPEIQAPSTSFDNPESTFTWGGLVTGLLIGTLTCLMNTYLGLQTGSVNGLPLASALMIGLIAARVDRSPLDGKQVLFGVAVATSASVMPITAGLLGVIPALQYWPEKEGFQRLDASWQLALWGLGLSFFGPLLAMPLRDWFLVRNPLPFPQAVALVEVIGLGVNAPSPMLTTQGRESSEDHSTGRSLEQTQQIPVICPTNIRFKTLIAPSIGSAIWTIIAAAVKVWGGIGLINDPPSWFRMENALSTVIIGAGMVTPCTVALDACMGLVFGWTVLPYLAAILGERRNAGHEADVEERRLWLALTALLVDCLMNLDQAFRGLGSVVERNEILPDADVHSTNVRTLSSSPAILRAHHNELEDLQKNAEDSEPPGSNLTPWRLCMWSLAASIFCFAVVDFTFRSSIRFWVPVPAIFVAILAGYMSTQAVGVTGIDPASGLAKLSLILFGIMASMLSLPHAFTVNLIAGAIAEAGAVQGPSLIENLKAGRELMASPDAILAGQIIGSVWGALIAAPFYKYLIGSSPPRTTGGFDVPAARMWIAASKAALSLNWPRPATVFWVGLTAAFFVFSGMMQRSGPRNGGWRYWLPKGSSFAMGLYVNPGVTVARAIGGAFQFWWCRGEERDDVGVKLFGSGLMLGYGFASIPIMILKIVYAPK